MISLYRWLIVIAHWLVHRLKRTWNLNMDLQMIIGLDKPRIVGFHLVIPGCTQTRENKNKLFVPKKCFAGLNAPHFALTLLQATRKLL